MALRHLIRSTYRFHADTLKKLPLRQECPFHSRSLATRDTNINSPRRFHRQRWPPLCTSSDSAWTEQQTRQEMLHTAMEKLAEADLETAVEKYNLEEELFAEIDFVQVDAFADHAFSGNPAAVCYLPVWRDDAWLQSVALEFNLAETAFLVRRRPADQPKPVIEAGEDGRLRRVRKGTGEAANESAEFDLRWFTPKVEVDLCGHATLASAHLLFSSGIVDSDNTITFHTRSGPITAKRVQRTLVRDAPGGEGEGEGEEEETAGGSRPSASLKRSRPPARTVIEMDMPAWHAAELPRGDWDALRDVMGGREVVWAGVSPEPQPYVLVELASEAAVREYTPDFARLGGFGKGMILITARAEGGSDLDIVSRFFCPTMGGDPEDWVTGSAHCLLATYWTPKIGKETLQAFQASARGGHVTVTWDKDIDRVRLQGSSVTVMAGVLMNTTIV